MTPEETLALTQAMIAAGRRLTWPGRQVADKHCIGGVPGNRTSLIIAPIVAVLLVVRLATEQPRFAPRLCLRLTLALAAAGVIAGATIWAVYGFRFSAGAPMTTEAWAAIRTTDSFLSAFAEWLHTHRLMPETWLVDLRAFASSSGHRRTFLLGEHAIDGWWYFFPVGWFFKTPLAVQLSRLASVPWPRVSFGKITGPAPSLRSTRSHPCSRSA